MKCTLLIASMLTLGLAAGAQDKAPQSQQKNLFVSATFMYGFPAAGQVISGWGNAYSGTQNVTNTHGTYDFKKASLASGVYGKIGFGYFFGDHVGLGLNVNIGLSNKKYTYTETSTVTNNSYTREYIRYAKMPVIVTPSLMVRSGGTKLNLIASGGLALPIAAKTLQEFTFINAKGTEFQKMETRNSMSLGFSGSVRVMYHVSPHVGLHFGLSGMMLSVSAKETELIEYGVNGMNALPYLSADEKIIKHKEEGSFSGTSNILPAYDMPFSNVGIDAGVTFWF